MERPTPIHLFASHPLLVEQVRTALADGAFQVLEDTLPPVGTPQLERGALVLVDLTGTASAEDVVERLLTSAPGVKIILLSDQLEDERALALMRQGARGFLTFHGLQQHLPMAVKSVSGGGIWASRALMAQALDAALADARKSTSPAEPVPLSRREREIRDALLQNLSNKEIAERLHITERTVKFHVSNLLSKFHVRRRADLILLSLQPARRDDG